MKKLLAAAILISAISAPMSAFAAGTSCTATWQGETQVANCSPIADPDAYYYAGPDTEFSVSALKADDTLLADSGSPVTVAFLGIAGNERLHQPHNRSGLACAQATMAVSHPGMTPENEHPVSKRLRH